jgi:hypothetical protein
MSEKAQGNRDGSNPPLSEEEAAQILSERQPPDHFTVLSRRRATPISDEQAAAILKEQSPPSPKAAPLPLAKPAGPKPPEVLPYRGKPDGFDADAMPPPHTMPLGYRVLRLALWLSVAVVSLGAMFSSVRCER